MLLLPLPAVGQFAGGSGGGGASGGQTSGGGQAGGGAGGGQSFNGGFNDFGVGASSDYELAPQDLVMVEMFGQPDIRTVQRLTSNGEIRLPLIGRVSLRGLTVREAELEIERLYREGGYYVEPQIMLSVQQYSERYVAVFGQVRNPQRIPFPPETEEMGILQAITMAGGFTRIAKMDAVQVSRTNEKGEQERFEVDVSRLLKAKRSSDESEFKLLPGDLVFVPERTF